MKDASREGVERGVGGTGRESMCFREHLNVVWRSLHLKKEKIRLMDFWDLEMAR